MYPHRLTLIVILAACLIHLSDDAAAQITVTRGAQMAIDVAVDGRIAMDLGGDLWVVPGSGGDAQQLTTNLKSVQRPRWSPDASRIAYLANTDEGQGLWILDLVSQQTQLLADPSQGAKLQPQWHPDGERLLFAAATAGSGFDLWEMDIATGLKWRLTQQTGDETGGSWSADGRDLVYVSQHDDHWSLMLRQHGRPDEILTTSTKRIAAPSWRPDGSLITYFHFQESVPTLKMVILSQPRLLRTYAENENFLGQSVSWRNRDQMYFVANGEIRRRDFDAWSSRRLPFRATIYPPPAAKPDTPRPELQWFDEPQGEFVIQAARVFDGIDDSYKTDVDLLIRGGRIAAIEAHRERPGSIVINLGDLAIIPGIIDVDARLPANLTASHGPDLLTMGVTTVVSLAENSDELARLWSGKSVPGPRILHRDTWGAGHLSPPDFDITAAVSTSASSGQLSGEALATQLRSLQHAGLSARQSLRALGVNAAGAIRADPFLGRIAVGAAADLVFVDGDPLEDSSDVLNVVAVVRNGRFYSVSGLFDRAKSAEIVE